MGDQCPSLAPPCPQTPGLGLAGFRTSPSLDWVSPVAPAQNTVRAMQYLFFSLDFSPIQSLNCTPGFYPPSGPPHCDLTVYLPSVSLNRSLAPSQLDAWSSELLDCLDDHFHVLCPVCIFFSRAFARGLTMIGCVWTLAVA